MNSRENLEEEKKQGTPTTQKTVEVLCTQVGEISLDRKISIIKSKQTEEQDGSDELRQATTEKSESERNSSSTSLVSASSDDEEVYHDANSTLRAESSKSGGDDDEEEHGEHSHTAGLVLDPQLCVLPGIRGIEDENVVADYRAKLYCFDSNEREWKERGLGQIKLLQSRENPKQCRVVMWRDDGTGRVACNFRLYPEFQIKYHQSSSKALSWNAFDYYDEDDPVWEVFTCKFQTEVACDDFKDKLLLYAKEPPVPCPSLITVEGEQEDSPCQGCIGCNSPTFEFKQNPSPTLLDKTEEPLIDCALADDSCTNVTVQKQALKEIINILDK